MVLQMAQKGQVQSQITDSYLKQMLEGISDAGVRGTSSCTGAARLQARARRVRARARPRWVCSSQGETKTTSIKFDRRRFADDDESDVDLDDL